MAAHIAEALGYRVDASALARGRRAKPDPRATRRWMPSFDWRTNAHAIYLDSERPLRHHFSQSEQFLEGEAGSWDVALLSRLPSLRREKIELGRLARDQARRVALVHWFEVGGREVAVVGTHMAHLTHGSPAHYVRLARSLRATLGDTPSVLAGDMNLWGPPASAFLKGWKRAVKGRTWPGWRPHSQVDHIFVRDLRVVSGRVLGYCGSDHRPVSATLTLDSGT